MFKLLSSLLLFLVCGAVSARAADLKEELWEAARKGDAATVRALFEQGVDVNAKTPQGTTALGLAADNGHLEVVQLLLHHKADMNGADLLGFTPLGQAIAKKHTAVAKALLEAGAEGGENTIRRAVWSGQAELVQTILNMRKVKPEVISEYLNWVGPQQAEVLKVLLKALLEAGGPGVENALIAAARTGQVELVREVLAKAKPKPEAITKALEATPAQQVETQMLLLNAVLAAGGETVHIVLTNAATKGQVEVVRALLAKAKPSQEVLNKALAATSAKQETIVKLLTGAGAAGVPTPVVRVDAKTLQSYAGAYGDEERYPMEIVYENGNLALKDRARSFALEPLDQTTFKMADNENVKFSFQTDKEKVVSFIWQSPFRTATYKRLEQSKAVMDPIRKVVVEKPIKVAVPKNWPSFRGPSATGVADEQKPPTTWDIKQGIQILWKTPLAGLGHSSPIVWKDRIFLTTAIPSDPKVKLQRGSGDQGNVNDSSTYSWRVYCLEKQTGKILWERIAHEGLPQSNRHAKATYANSTPVTDGNLVVICFGSEGLFCYDFQGNLVWKQSLGLLDSGWAYDSKWKWGRGFASSPILYHGLVIVQCDWGKTPFIAAYDLQTGNPVWRTPRAELPTHGTPTVYEGKDRAVVIANGASHVRGYDPLTGKELWSLASDNGGEAVPTPITGHDLIFVTFGWSSGGPLFAIRPTATGDISLKDRQTANEFIAWSSQRDGPYLPTPLVYGDYLYCCSFRGMLTCLDARTGKRLYRERLGGSSTYTASPVAADGRLYFAGENGSIRVIKAGPKFHLLAVNQMGDACLATPAISDGMIFVRTLHDLFGIARQETVKSPGTR